MKDDKIKIDKLDFYHEDRNELNNWLIQLKIYFRFNTISQKRKTLFAFTFLRKRIEKWFKFLLKKHFDDDSNSEVIFFVFNNFKTEIRRVFEASHEEEIAKRIVQLLHQKTSAAKYAIRFQKQVNLIEWDDAALMIMFRRDLKNNVKKELMRYDDKIDSLRILIETTIELDDKLYKLAMKKRYNDSREKIESYTRSASYRSERSKINKRSNDDYEIVSMKLNLTQRRKNTNSKRS
jgi:hypothetical protein